MLKLSKEMPRATKVALAGGAYVDVRAATTLDYHAALAEVVRVADAIRRGEEALEEAGIDAPELLEDAALRAGLSEYLLAVELGARCITAWHGIGDEEGNPLDPGRDSIMALMRDPVAARLVMGAALQSIHRIMAEGEDFAVSRNGAGAAAEPIVPTAAN